MNSYPRVTEACDTPDTPRLNIWRPSRSDPLGQDKSRVGEFVVDRVCEELSARQCIQLALNKLDRTDSNRERKLTMTKLEEALLWHDAEASKGYR